MKYKIIALIGQAGSGKDTILKKIINQSNLHEIISCTTRPKRDYEIAGVHYHFYTIDDFTSKVLNNEMLEATEFNGWFYGTSLDSLNANKINVGVFNPDGISAIYDRNDIDLKIYYINASDKNRLLRQLNRENEPNVEEIIRRYKTDKLEFFNIENEFVLTLLDNNLEESIENNVNIILQDCKNWLDESN